MGKRTRRITIGLCNAMPVRVARDKGKDLLAQIANRIDPVEEKERLERSGVTLDAVFREYLARRLPSGKSLGQKLQLVS